MSTTASVNAPRARTNSRSHKGATEGLKACQPAALHVVRTLTTTQICAAVGRDLSQEGGERSVQQRVAYQGVPGAYSEAAALRACPGSQPLPCEQFELAFQALSQWLAERAVLPIQNSLGGSIHDVYDLLNRYRLHIVGEVLLPINHCLLALPGVTKQEVRRVMSHPQALAQCDNYLRNLNGVVRESVSDTAGAARDIARQSLRDAAAIASERASELYGLQVLERAIQDERDNVTRFIVLSRDPLEPSSSDVRPFKTSLAFTLPEGPGQLYKVLSIFALKGIDLTMIESRPNRVNPIAEQNGSGRRFQYMFYIDFLGSTASLNVKQALRHLQEVCPYSRVLGCYPLDQSGPLLAASGLAPLKEQAAKVAVEEQLEAELLGFGSPDNMGRQAGLEVLSSGGTKAGE
eukprot:jgi/Botrbrau1/3620/Bobra.0204s0014.1